MPPPRAAQPSGALQIASVAVKQFMASKGAAQIDDALLSNCLQRARARISLWTEWAFARTKETFTTDGNTATSGLVLSANFAGELGVYQTAGGTNKRRLEYMTPDEYERAILIDTSTTSDLTHYTILNAKEIYFYLSPASGVTLTIFYNLDLMDDDTALPARFGDALAAWALFFYGAPPPDGANSWEGVAEKATNLLRIRDRRPSARRPIIPQMEDEDVLALRDISTV